MNGQNSKCMIMSFDILLCSDFAMPFLSCACLSISRKCACIVHNPMDLFHSAASQSFLV